MSTHRLDVHGLYQRLDERRQQYGISWREIARQCDISPNVTSRLQRGTAPDADTLLTLLLWLNPHTYLNGLATLNQSLA